MNISRIKLIVIVIIVSVIVFTLKFHLDRLTLDISAADDEEDLRVLFEETKKFIDPDHENILINLEESALVNELQVVKNIKNSDSFELDNTTEYIQDEFSEFTELNHSAEVIQEK